MGNSLWKYNELRILLNAFGRLSSMIVMYGFFKVGLEVNFVDYN